MSKKLESKIETMFAGQKAKCLSIDHVKPSAVCAAHKEGASFFAGDINKGRFPDAFIFECLGPEASEETLLVIASDDEDFNAPVDDEEHIWIFKSILDLFRRLGLESTAPEIDQFLDENLKPSRELAETESAGWGLEATDVEDARIEQTGVVDFEVIEFAAFAQVEGEGSILVVGTAKIEVAVSYTHPNRDDATHDS